LFITDIARLDSATLMLKLVKKAYIVLQTIQNKFS